MPGFSLFYWFWFAVCAFFMYTKTLQVHLLSGLSGTASSTLSVAGTPMLASDDPGRLAAAASGDAGGVGGGGLLAAATRALLPPLLFVVHNYVPLSFAAYTLGFLAFVLSLRRRRHFRYQFAQFAYCHCALLVVVVQSTFLVANAYRGLLWFFIPCGAVVVNDGFAYVAGFFWGRTPLIRLSPKKTWEGFIGGGAATLAFVVLATGWLQSPSAGQLRYTMLCPVEHGMGFTPPHCDVSEVGDGLYIPRPLGDLLGGGLPLPAMLSAVAVSRMQLHALVLGLFAASVAPFGGFFASGFKRAFKIKDFSAAIPGHGGVTDRMDCQIAMGSFSYVYAHYFLKIGAGYQ